MWQAEMAQICISFISCNMYLTWRKAYGVVEAKLTPTSIQFARLSDRNSVLTDRDLLGRCTVYSLICSCRRFRPNLFLRNAGNHVQDYITQSHNPEDHNLNSHYGETFKYWASSLSICGQSLYKGRKIPIFERTAVRWTR